ncbi:MAG TPA: nucleoside hydrolase [Phycisphaerales bacterium]|nr:nucleoside hydrolase [Phycisphaerales bacterium]
MATGQAQPVKIILDTDMDGDCDDAGALAVLHALADNGEAEILAVGTCGRNPWSPLTIDAINTYYGRAGIPVGAAKGNAPLRPSRYTQAVAERCPHALHSAEQAHDAVELYRRLLSQAEDRSVTLVTIGYHTNVANLLRSGATGGAAPGLDLVARKVRQWVCMGGNFIGSPARDDLSLGNANFLIDPAATLYAISHWPGRILFAGREVGSVPSGLQAGRRLAETPPDNPVRIAYECYFGGEAKDRHVADPVTVLCAVRGLRDYWDLHDTGYMDLKPDMSFEWKAGGDGRQAYLLKKKLPGGQPNDRYVEGACEALMVQPPARRKP